MRQSILLSVQDQPGVLMRVAGIITAKGANIHSLTVSPDPAQQGIAQIRIVADVEEHLKRRVVNEMNRLIQVFEAIDVTPESVPAADPFPDGV
jgi:acetolactate synthase I/III small subunit